MTTMQTRLGMRIHVRDILTHRLNRLSGSRLFARLSEASPARRASCRLGFRLWCPASCRSFTYCDSAVHVRDGSPALTEDAEAHTPSEITRDAGDNRLVFASRGDRSLKMEAAPASDAPAERSSRRQAGSRHSRNFEFRDISSSRVRPDVAGDVSIPRLAARRPRSLVRLGSRVS
jgi:hypothetical protein